MDLKKIDTNFATCSVNGVNFTMYNPKELGLEGFPWHKENEHIFTRLPERVLPDLNENLQNLAKHTAGGVIRFRTDSKAILLKGNYYPFWIMHHMAITGQAGFDIVQWENGRGVFLGNLQIDSIPVAEKNFSFEFSRALPEGMHEYRIFMPLYSGIESLQIGLSEGATIEKAPIHKVEKPILFYGSSITQGGCASRPSNCHAALLSQAVDAEQINLGFSGNAKGEKEMAELIASLDLSCFVMDYDYNAPTPEHLQNTHEPFFKIIREKHPDLPVVMISRCFTNPDNLEDTTKRRNIIMQTYLNARTQGDAHVYFVDGLETFAQEAIEWPTVDRCHPTDLGFYLMTKRILPTLKQALGL